MENKLIERLKEVFDRYNVISSEMQDPEVISDSKRYSQLSKEEAKLKNKYEVASKYFSLKKDIREAEEIISMETDVETKDMFNQQIISMKKEMNDLIPTIEEALVETDPADELDAIIEIEGKAGGDEANIFAGDLMRMYQKWAPKHNLRFELLESTDGTAGGFSTVTFVIRGVGAYGLLKYESGIHRVQRVPVTETAGRIHTSTASVLVVPEVDDTIEVEINKSDIKVDTYRASGAGGQHINKTDSAIRITHLPTGIVVTSQDGRSQHDNRDKAMNILKSKIYEAKLREEQEKNADAKKSLVGSGDRSEKIRTYNYPQNRITDHRVSLTLKKLDRVMEGGLDEIIDYIRATIRDESKT